jgi:hypothetical protein
VADRPLRPATDRRLGSPLHYLLANLTRAHFQAINFSPRKAHPVLAVVSNCCPRPEGRFSRVTHPSATITEVTVRLACVKHTASVHPEPGSNSPFWISCIHVTNNVFTFVCLALLTDFNLSLVYFFTLLTQMLYWLSNYIIFKVLPLSEPRSLALALQRLI